MAHKTTKPGNFETLEAKKLMTADLGMDFVEAPEPDKAFVKSWSTSGDADDRPTEEVAFYYNKIAFAYAASTDGKALSEIGDMHWDNVQNIPWTDDSDDTSEIEFVDAGTGGRDAASAAGTPEYFTADSFSFGIEREMKESGEKGGTEDINIGLGELQECTISKSMDNASTQLAQQAINGNSCNTAEIEFVEVAGTSSTTGESDFLKAGPRGGPHVNGSTAATDSFFRDLADESGGARRG